MLSISIKHEVPLYNPLFLYICVHYREHIFKGTSTYIEIILTHHEMTVILFYQLLVKRCSKILRSKFEQVSVSPLPVNNFNLPVTLHDHVAHNNKRAFVFL